MSSHCHRCIIHPQHNKVGVCGLCVRERLVALVDECSSSSVEVKRCSSPASGAGTASDEPYHSFSSSSAVHENHLAQLSPPCVPPAEPLNRSEQPIHLPPLATTSLLQKFKFKAFAPSPEHAFAKNTSGFHSPSPTIFHQKNKLSLPFRSRKSSVSELAEGLYMHAKVADDQISAPSTMLTVGQRKPSLMSLFHQSEVAPYTSNHTVLEGSENAIHAPSEERRRRIEQFSAAMRSPGFAFPSTKAATLSDYRQTYTAEYLADHRARDPFRGSTEQASNSSYSSWIASLFQRKKWRTVSKSKSKAIVSEVTLINEVLAEASARNSVDYNARVSVDTGGMLKQMIRSRVQQVVKAEAMTNSPMNEVGAKARYMEGWAPVDSEHLSAKVEPVTDSTAKMGINNKLDADHEAHMHVSEQVRNFPRSRSCGRAWSRTHSSQFFTGSPQHQLHPNNNNSVPQHQHQYLTSTPKHPAAMADTAAPKDSRSVAFGFYFGPFRRSKRQGLSCKQS